jgi:hypothetical protein
MGSFWAADGARVHALRQRPKRCTKLGTCACESFGVVNVLAPLSTREALVVNAVMELKQVCGRNRYNPTMEEVATMYASLYNVRSIIDANKHGIQPLRLAQLMTHVYVCKDEDVWFLERWTLWYHIVVLHSLVRSRGVVAADDVHAMCTWALECGACPAVATWRKDDQGAVVAVSIMDRLVHWQKCGVNVVSIALLLHDAGCPGACHLAGACTRGRLGPQWQRGHDAGCPGACHLADTRGHLRHQWQRWHGRRQRRVWVVMFFS